MGVILEKNRSKITVFLPLSGGTVELWEYPLVGEIMDNVSVIGTTPQMPTPLEAVVKLIASWNFTDENGNALPITKETLSKIPTPDFVVIAKAVEKALSGATPTTEEKKSTQDNSI